MKFEELYEKAGNRGFTLSKAAKPARAGKRPIQYVLENHHNLLHFRSLEEVERQLSRQGRHERDTDWSHWSADLIRKRSQRLRMAAAKSI